MADPDEEDEVGDIDAPEDLSRQSGDGQSVPILGDIGINSQDDEGSEDRNSDIESPSRLSDGFEEGCVFTNDLLSLVMPILGVKEYWNAGIRVQHDKNETLWIVILNSFRISIHSITPLFSFPPSQDVINLRLCSQFRLSLKNGPIPEGLSDLGFGLLQIAKDQRLLLAGLDTGGEETLQKPLLAKITLFNDAFRPGWKVQIDLLDERPWDPSS